MPGTVDTDVDTTRDADDETESPNPTPPPPSSSPVSSDEEQEALYSANDFWAYVDDILEKLRIEARRIHQNDVQACNNYMDRSLSIYLSYSIY